MGNQAQERRHPRVTLPQRLRASLGLSGDLWLVNLSLGGAMAEHAARLAPGDSAVLVLHVAGEDFRLKARVIWSRVQSITPTATGEKEIRFRSGLQFPELSSAAEAHLREFLAGLGAPGAALAGERV